MTYNSTEPNTLQRNAAESLKDFIQASPTAWHAVKELRERFESKGFRRFKPGEHSELKPGDRIYTTMNHSAFFAFVVGERPLDIGMRLVGSHTDSPALKIKPNHLRRSKGALTLNAEIYGGPIMNSFFDHPLGLAGQVWVATDDPLRPEYYLVNPKDLRIILPSLAIHLNREVNKGVKIEPQKVMLPVLGLDRNSDDDADGDGADSRDLLVDLLARSLNLETVPEILSFDLMTYDATPPAFVGMNEELLNSPRIDNLAMAHASATALLDALDHAEETGTPLQGIIGMLATDNEEIGSRTPQGAASLYLRDLITAIVVAAGGRSIDISPLLSQSFMISADQAHAVHPNYAEMYDPDNHPVIGGGPVIKHASGSYATSSRSAAVFRQLCAAAGVSVQDFTNRTDLRGGSTIGPITAVNLPMPTVDVGNAIWGMHSLRETAAVSDHLDMIKVLSTFYGLT